MKRSHRIALFARRFRVLADRDEFLRPDPAERVEATLRERRAIPLSRFDQVQVVGSGEIDRLCAAAVRRLRSYAKGQVALLDVLGHMEADRICGVYFALPEPARKRLHNDGVWDYHVRRVEREMPDAIAEIESLAQESEQFAKRQAAIVAEMAAEDEATWAAVERERLRAQAGVVPSDADIEAAKAEARELLRRGRARAEELLGQ